ncbi:ABC-F family ATP-binding cassette domain-containing protein [Clostridium sp. MSJ-11]|uniref:ABC-F family ATP-binding cassette domain-containing protein n=1 Tax=Clostridium mobile TaxID=2841512 RepID=A0ABS6ELN7_9CLOT|nr:ABC-F family ATP-binding cassette domain-containing protein [Clostridium mobile]MBU5485319.1 ABC-F family ATP-binding cassette domain-containing protein [Clostridium mobile]
MIILSCKDLNKSYGIDTILEKVTLGVNEGDKIGLIGPNGAGKSTLLKIISGIIDYDGGELFIDKSKKVGYLSQHLTLDSNSTIYSEMLSVFSELISLEEKLRELEIKMNEPYDAKKADYHNKIINEYTATTELYSNKNGYAYKGEISRVLKGLGFSEDDYDKEIKILSGGQKTRVALCKLLLLNPEILLLDEPTNHLDLDAIEWLEEYLKSYKGSIIIISHDRYFLDSVTNRTMELLNGKIISYDGNYTKFIEFKKKDFEDKLKAYNLQQAEIKRQEEIIERYRSFNREKSIRAAESRQKSLDKVVRIDAPDKDPTSAKINFTAQITSGNDVLYMENLSKSFGENNLFNNIHMDVKRGEKVALIGENGRGKTTLLKIIMEKESKDSGTIVLGRNVFIGYYDQEQSDLNPEKTILDEVWDVFPNMTTTEIRSALAAFLFRGEEVFKKISTLSGGEKCRINLLKLMLSESNLLLLDEPTNHLDIMSREALEDAIIEYNGTVMVISHDRYFLNKVINRIYELKENEAKEYLGNYSYYVEKKKNPLRYNYEEESEGKTKTQIQQEKRKKREAEKAEKEIKQKLKNIEEEISNKESYLVELQNDLCLEEIYSDPIKSEEVNKEILKIEKELENLYSQWENFIE